MRNEHALFPNGEYLIGDKGYQPVRTWLITPYKDTGALTQVCQQNLQHTICFLLHLIYIDISKLLELLLALYNVFLVIYKNYGIQHEKIIVCHRSFHYLT